MKRETKSFRFQVKAVDDEQGLIEAYGSVFDVADLGDDIVRPGAFKRTIQHAKSRVQAGKAKFLAPMLWQHDPGQPIGGWYDLKEDTRGLLCRGQIILTTQAGRECYELIKAGVIDQFSIGYDVPSGGSHYDSKTGYRELTELRLWEISPVTFAMNEEALLVGVKSASGKTDWPLGSRDEAWDGSAAHNAIVKWATKDDGSLDESKMKSVHFWYDASAPDKITSYKLAFCDIKNGKPVAIPRGIFACAASLMGARRAPDIDDVDAVKAKVAGYYRRMAKEFDDESIVVPWSSEGDSGGGKARPQPAQQRKTLQEHYNEEMCEDLLEDWQDVYISALTKAVFDALMSSDGDLAAADISQALDDFKTLVLNKFVTQAQECNLSQFLSESSAMPAMQYGTESPYDGRMSRTSSPLARKSYKAGRAISAANANVIQSCADDLHGMADDAMSMMRAHAKSLHGAADNLVVLLSDRQELLNQPGNTESEASQEKATSPVQARGMVSSSSSDDDTMNEQELEQALYRLRALSGARSFGQVLTDR